MNGESYRAALDVTELLGELKRLLLVRHRADRLICRYLADLADGIPKWPALLMAYGNAQEFVRATLGFSRRAARERIRVGRALRTLPVLDAAWTAGQISYSQVREVTRVATDKTERVWLRAVQQLSPRALERRVSDASGKPRPQSSNRPPSSDPEHVTVSIPRDVWALLDRALHAVKAAHSRELTDGQALAVVAQDAIAHYSPRSADQPPAPNDRATDAPRATNDRSTGAPRATNDRPRATNDRATDAPRATNDRPRATNDRATDAARATNDRATDAPRTTHSGSYAVAHDRWAESDRARITSPLADSDADDPGSTLREAGGSGSDGGTTTGGAERGHFAIAPTRLRKPVPPSAGGSDPTKTLSADARLLLDLIGSGGLWSKITLEEASGMPHGRLVEALVDLEFSRLVTRDLLGFYEPSVRQAG